MSFATSFGLSRLKCEMSIAGSGLGAGVTGFGEGLGASL